jgi:hypothetical protein
VAGNIEVLQIIPQLIEEFAGKPMAHDLTILPQKRCSAETSNCLDAFRWRKQADTYRSGGRGGRDARLFLSRAWWRPQAGATATAKRPRYPLPLGAVWGADG